MPPNCSQMRRYLVNYSSLILVFLLFSSTLGRLHTLRLNNDARSSILCSTFSYDEQATLSVELRNLHTSFLGQVGFTFDKRSNTCVQSAVKSKPSTCLISGEFLRSFVEDALVLKLDSNRATILRPCPSGTIIISSITGGTDSLKNLAQTDDEFTFLVQPMSQFLEKYSVISGSDAQKSAKKICTLIKSNHDLSLSTKQILKGMGDVSSRIYDILLLFSSQYFETVVLRHRRDVLSANEDEPESPVLLTKKTNSSLQTIPISNANNASSDSSSAFHNISKASSSIAENSTDPETHSYKVDEHLPKQQTKGSDARENNTAKDRAANKRLGARSNNEDGLIKQAPFKKTVDSDKKKTYPVASTEPEHEEKESARIPSDSNSKEVVSNNETVAAKQSKTSQNLSLASSNRDSEKKKSVLSGKEIALETPELSTPSLALGRKDYKSARDDVSVEETGVISDYEEGDLEEKPSNNEVPTESQTDEDLLSTINAAIEKYQKSISKQLPLVIRDGTVSLNFTIRFLKSEASGTYDLFFHNCAGENLNAEITITEKNNENYLSTGDQPLPVLFATFSVIYLFLSLIFFSYLRFSKEPVFRIHHLMLALIIIKSISLACHAASFYAIGVHGVPEEGWVIMYYIAHMTRGFLFFLTVLLIGTGWNFFKHVFTRREKNLFIVVVPLQILANIATVVIEESELGASRFLTWNEIFTIVDLICCAAILFPVIWSIRHLQAASLSDGKAAQNLRKLRLFKQFYVMVICYIYFTRIVVYILKISVPFSFNWLVELFEQVVTLAFLISVGYKFRPFNDNPYLQLPTDDEEDTLMERFELEEAWTQSGLTDGVTRLHKPQNLQSAGASRRERNAENLRHLVSHDDPEIDDDGNDHSDRQPLVRP